MNGRPDYPPRPPSEQLVDLHVYLVPAELWQDHLQSAVNQIINDTVSAGFIRVLPETTINAMRSDLENQLDDMLPRDYVFLKSVGRCLARVRPKQEYQLKAKNFLPPQAYSPEIFILEVSPEVRATFPPSGASSERSDSRPAPNSSDPYSHYRPIPPIKNGSSSGYPYNGDPNSGEDHFRKPYKNSPNPYSITPDNYTRSFATQTGTITPPSVSPFHKDNQSHPNVNPNRYNIHTQTRFPSNEPEKSRRSQSGTRSSSVHTQTNFDNHYPNPNANTDHVTYRVASHDQRSAHYPGGKQGAASPRGMNGYSANTASNTVNPSYSQISAPHTNQHVGRVVDKSPHRGGNHHGRSAHAGETARTPGDSSQTPLSASPPNSPVPGETKPLRSPSAGDYRSQQGEGYLPPLSATPPHTPDTSKYRLTNGADAGLNDLERRRMDEMYRNDDRNNTGNMDRNNAGKMDRNNAGNMDRNYAGNMDRNYAGNAERNSAGNISRNVTGNDHREYEGENQGKSASSSQDLSNQRQAEEKAKREWEEEERRRKEEERRRWEEEQRKNAENRRRESEDERLRREAEERRRREEDEARRRQLEAMNRTPADRAREKERLMEELEQARQDRKAMERRREEYVRKAKGLQARTQQKRNQARDLWKKKYFEEKKKTAPLEDQSNKLKQELDSLHKRIMATLEGPKDAPKRASDKPSSQSNYKIQATRLQHDIEDLQRRVDNVKMKLTAEMKLRNQAESELRALRAEVTQKKINLTLTRSQLGPISQQKDQTVNNPAPSPMVTQR